MQCYVLAVNRPGDLIVSEILTNKPLKEVIFELHWDLPEEAPSGEKFDPDYRRFLARMEDAVIDDYAEYRQLPAADIPEKLIPHVVQHQYWTKDETKDDNKTWPVIQVGPGIIAVNNTAGYHWSDFKDRISYLVGSFFKAHPNSDKLNLSKILLKYVNAIEFDYDQDNILAFLRDKLKISIDMTPIIPQDEHVTLPPVALNLVTTFVTQEPSGALDVRFRRGAIHDDDVLFWELTSVTIGNDVPDPVPQDIVTWADSAHSLIRGIFFRMIDGKLLETFK